MEQQRVAEIAVTGLDRLLGFNHAENIMKRLIELYRASYLIAAAKT